MRGWLQLDLLPRAPIPFPGFNVLIERQCDMHKWKRNLMLCYVMSSHFTLPLALHQLSSPMHTHRQFSFHFGRYLLPAAQCQRTQTRDLNWKISLSRSVCAVCYAESGNVAASFSDNHLILVYRICMR